MNKDTVIPQVCSFQRSGTHLLSSLIWKNFKLPDMSREIDVPGQSWHGPKDKPWVGLVGSHRKYPDCKNTGDGFSDEQIIYIYRDPKDTLYSYYRFHRGSNTPGMHVIDDPEPDQLFRDWISEEIVRAWKEHVESFLGGDTEMVKYEQLVGGEKMFRSVMKHVGKKYGLEKRHAGFSNMKNLIGWSPGDARTDYHVDYSHDVMDVFQEVLGKSFRGYRFDY